MARDDRTVVRKFPFEAVLHGKYGTSVWMAGDRDLLVRRSVRADKISTPRSASGHYYAATPYYSFHTHAIHRPYVFQTFGIGGDPGAYVEERGEAAEPPFAYWDTWGCGTLAPHPPSVAFDVIQQVRSMVLAKARAREWDMGTFIGEGREAVGLIVGKWLQGVRFLAAFYNLGKKIPKGLPTRSGVRPKNWSKIAATNWLQYQYGIRPLMQDLWAMLKLLEEGLKDKPVGRIFVDLPDTSYTPPSVYGFLDGTIDGSFKRGFKSEITVRVDSPGLYQLDNYGITNPLLLAWELTTLSFVVDWFLHVGNFLDGLVPPIGLSFAGGYETSYLENRWHAEWSPKGSRGVPKASLHVTTKSHVREPLYMFSIPRPYLDLDLSTSEIVSGLSLLKTILGGS